MRILEKKLRCNLRWHYDPVEIHLFNGSKFSKPSAFRVRPEGFYLVGDAQTWIEGPIAAEQIFAMVTKIQRKGRQIGPRDGIWKFFQYVWIRLIPLRPFLVRLYTRLVK